MQKTEESVWKQTSKESAHVKQAREAGKEGKDSGTLTLRLGAEITLHMAH